MLLIILLLSFKIYAAGGEDVSTHPFYPVALERVFEDQSVLPGLEWAVMNEEQRDLVRENLSQVVRETEKVKETIAFTESVMASRTFTPPTEDRAADRAAFTYSFKLLPKQRVDYLQKIANSLGLVVAQMRAHPEKREELKALVGRLLLESDRVWSSTEGRPEQVGQEAAKMYSVLMIAEMLSLIATKYISVPHAQALMGVALVVSVVSLIYNVQARESTTLRPLFYFPGAYGRSARATEVELRRRFWNDVEIALLEHGIGKVELGLEWDQSIQSAVELRPEGGRVDVTALDCQALMMPEAFAKLVSAHP